MGVKMKGTNAIEVLMLDILYRENHELEDQYRMPSSVKLDVVKTMSEAEKCLKNNDYLALLVVPTVSLFHYESLGVKGKGAEFLKTAKKRNKVIFYSGATEEMINDDFIFKKGVHYDVYFDRMDGDLKNHFIPLFC
ncbi:hypothetical protein ACFL1H_05075, partial [Nanoarchaeota archaeon]